MSNAVAVMKRTYTEIVEVKQGQMDGLQEVLVKTLSTGKEKWYKVYDGTYYNVETPDGLIRVLNGLCHSRTRFRIFLGDMQTGYDWAEEYDTVGTIGRSTGDVKIPLLIPSVRSHGGHAILTHCIVKIIESNGGRVLWKHPNYQKPEFTIVERGKTEFPAGLSEEYTTAVIRTNDKDGKSNRANFRNRKSAEGYVAFLTGQRNSRAYGLEVVKK